MAERERQQIIDEIIKGIREDSFFVAWGVCWGLVFRSCPVKMTLFEISTVFFLENRQKDCAISRKACFDRLPSSETPEKTVQNQRKLVLTGNGSKRKSRTVPTILAKSGLYLILRYLRLREGCRGIHKRLWPGVL